MTTCAIRCATLIGIACASAACGNTHTPGAQSGSVDETDAATVDAATTDPGDAGPTCAPDPSAPTDTSDAPRRMLPWTLVRPGDAGVTSPGPDDGSARDAGNTAASGCEPPSGGSSFDSVHCHGDALVRRAAAYLELVFADGSALRWTPERVPVRVAAPLVVDATTVWVDYTHQVEIYCPFCGSYYADELSIHESMGGQLLFIAREGQKLDDIGAPLVDELFGVSVHQDLVCHSSYVAGCTNVERTVFDHTLETQPEQRLEHAKVEHVITPKGEYEVVWARSIETTEPIPLCADGPGAASDTGFAASRL